MNKLFRFKSLKKNNHFAPEWEYYIFENVMEDIDFDKVARLILSKEKEIIEHHPPAVGQEGKQTDGYTGLGLNSLTSRFQSYNILKWEDDEIKKIKNNIIFSHDAFLKMLDVDRPHYLFAKGWANVMRKGEQIKPHLHGVNPDTYLGGHISVQTEDTSTHYINPVNQLNDPETHSLKNIVGTITIFQNCIPHYTDVHDSNKERITIAFDLAINPKIMTESFIPLY
jgi:hypothetical protein